MEDFYKSYGTKFCFENNLLYQINTKGYKIRDIFGWDKVIEKKFFDTYYYILLTTSNFLRPHTSEVIDKLRKNHKIIIITARMQENMPNCTEDNSMFEITKRWLKNNDIFFDQLIFSKVDKTQAIIKNRIDLMLEDNPTFLIDAAQKGIKSLCFDASYNYYLEHKNIIHICSWYDAIQVIHNQLERRKY